jgi:two-component system cell cycle response regulator
MKRKFKILIIDDDVLVRETVKIALSQAKFETVTLEAPALAHVVVRKSRPDLILMDLYMPELNGLDLCRRLKADPETRRIPVIIFTGSNETVDVISGIEAGAFEYITKPVDGELLIEKIRGILKLAPHSRPE